MPYPDLNSNLGKLLKRLRSRFPEVPTKGASRTPCAETNIRIGQMRSSGQLDYRDAQVHYIANYIEESITASQPINLITLVDCPSDLEAIQAHPSWNQFMLWCSKCGLEVTTVTYNYLPYPDLWGFDVTNMPKDYESNEKYRVEAYALRITSLT